MNAADRAARGIRVKQLLDSEDVQAALAAIEADIVDEWKASRFKWRRDAKWNEFRGLDRLRSRLANYAGQAPR